MCVAAQWRASDRPDVSADNVISNALRQSVVEGFARALKL